MTHIARVPAWGVCVVGGWLVYYVERPFFQLLNFNDRDKLICKKNKLSFYQN